MCERKTSQEWFSFPQEKDHLGHRNESRERRTGWSQTDKLSVSSSGHRDKSYTYVMHHCSKKHSVVLAYVASYRWEMLLKWIRSCWVFMNWHIECAHLPLGTAVKWEQDINLTVKCHWRRKWEQEGERIWGRAQGAPVFKGWEEVKGLPVEERMGKEVDNLDRMVPEHPRTKTAERGMVSRAQEKSLQIQVERHPLDRATTVTSVTLVTLIMGEM